MAKKEKFNSGSLDLDMDLDFGDMDFGDGNRARKDDRKPIIKAASNFAKGSIGGLKSAATNRAKIAKAIRAGMPKEYGEVMDRTGDVTSQVSSLYNEATTKLKPELEKITKQVDKLVPSEMRRTKGFLDRISKALGSDKTYSQFESQSLEEQNEGNIQSNLAEVFAATAQDTAQSRAEDRAERKINSKVEAKRFESSFGLLNSINVNMARMTNYTTKVNNAFQKKSLEVQYRSYFVQQDMLKTMKALSILMDDRTKDIVKNTGLPDFVKRTKSDDFKDMARRKMINATGGFLGRAVKNLVGAGKNKVDNLVNIFQQASLGLDMVETARDTMKTQREMAQSLGIEDTGKAGMLGDFLGGELFTRGARKLGKHAQKFTGKKGSKFNNTIFDILSFLNNGERGLKNFRNKHLQPDYSKGGILETIKEFLGSGVDIALAGGKTQGQYDKQFGHGLGNLHGSAEFNNFTQKSITTIIPGFLSRIHAEIRALRTNQDPKELLQFDMRSDRFAMSGKIERQTKSRLQSQINSNGLSYGLDNLYNHITGGKQLSSEAEKALRNKIHHHTFTGNGFDVEDLKNQDFLKGVSKKHSNEIKNVIDNRFDRNDVEYASRRAELTGLGKKASESIKDIDTEVQNLIDAGHADTLIKLKIIRSTRDGYQIAKNAFEKLSAAGFATSDVHAKKDISGFSGNKALNAIKKSRVYKWLYKQGKGDGGQHAGPMAQDLHKELGDVAAPGGKSIDLVTMNGVNMAAIQELDKKVGRSGRNSKEILLLNSISKNTQAIVNRLDALGHLSFGIPKLDTKNITEALKNQTGQLGSLFNQGRRTLGEKLSSIKAPEGLLDHAGNIAKSASAILGTLFEKAFGFTKQAGSKLKETSQNVYAAGKEFYKNNKDPAIETAKSLFNKGVNLVGRVFDSVSNVTTDILQNKLPAGWAQAVKAGSWLVGKGKNLIDPPRDIYVSGRDKPALYAIIMRAGGYFNQANNKPVHRPSDIQGPVIDNQGNVVLSIEDFELGLHDVEGKPIKSISQHLLELGSGILSKAKERLTSVFSSLKKAGGKIGTSIKNTGEAIKNRMGGFGFGGNKEAIRLLTEIRDILNNRLPGKKSIFSSTAGRPTNIASSIQQSQENASSSNASAPDVMGGIANAGMGLFNKGKEAFGGLIAKANEKYGTKLSSMAGKATGFKGRILGGLASGLAKFGQKPEATEEGSETETEKPSLLKSIFGGMLSSGKNLLGGRQAPSEDDIHNIHAKEGQREGGVDQQLEIQRAREAKRKAETKVNVADNTPRYKGKNIFDSIFDKAKGAFSSVIGGLGSLAETIFGSGGVAGALSKGAIGAAKLAGRGLLGAGRLGLSLGRFALSSAARIGAGQMLAGAGTMLGGAGGALISAGGAALAAITSPVGLTIGAIALGGYALYKGYKFLTRNKASPETAVRMLQYGLRFSESSNYHLMFKLEAELLENGIYYNHGQADLAKQKLNLKNILEIFGLTEETAEGPEGQAFLSWFKNRFKPVFLTHLTALFSVAPKLSLAEIDKLKKDDLGKFDRYFKAATNTPDVYQYTESPIHEVDQLRTTNKDVEQAVKDIRDEYKDKLDKDGKVKDGLLKTSLKSAFKFITKSDSLDNAIKAGGVKGMLARVAKVMPGGIMLSNALSATTKLMGRFAVGIKRFLTNAISALESVRFKTYGLKKFHHSHVSSIRNLEDLVSSMLSFNGSQASFNGDIGDIIKQVGSEFGLSSVKDEKAIQWTKWFSNRFLPVFLNYMGSGFQITGKKTAEDIEPSLSERQKYDVAVRLSGTNDVWDKDDSPWEDAPDLCTSSDECKDNLQYLKDKAGDEELKDPKAQARKKAATENSIKNQMTGSNSNDQRTYEIKKIFNTTNPKASSEGESIKLSTSGGPSRGNIATQGKVPLAKGPLANPDEGDQFITLKKGATLEGLNPELMRNFKMMAAEYGKMTGKSLTVNSGVRSKADQEAEYKKDPGKAAKPGTSLHEFGLALDVNTVDLNELEKLGLMRKYGFTRPVGGETWHMEAAGIQSNINLAKTDPNFALTAIKNSLGKGGGGYGIVTNSTTGHRNTELAAALLSDDMSLATSDTSKDRVNDMLKEASAELAKKEEPTKATTSPSPSTIPSANQTTLADASKTEKKEVSPRTIVASNSANKTFGRMEGFTEAEPGQMVKSAPSGRPDDIRAIIQDAAKQTGADPNTMLAFAALESGFKPSAKASTSSATGLFQFTSDTWKGMMAKYGKKYNLDPSTSPTDPRANALLAGEFIKDNARALSSVKSNPTATDLYIAHFLGSGGAKTFFKADPSRIAAEILPEAAKANKTIFYDGGRARTIAEVYNTLNNKVRNTAAHYGIQLPVSERMATNTTTPSVGESPTMPGTRARTTGGDIPQITPSQPGSPAPRVRGNNGQFPPAPSGPVGGVTTRPTITPPPVVGQGSQTPVPRPPIYSGQGNMNVGDGNPLIANIDTTLTQQLAVQMRIVELIQQFGQQSLQGGQMKDIAGGLGQILEHVVAGKEQKRSAPAPTAPVGLQRVIR